MERYYRACWIDQHHLGNVVRVERVTATEVKKKFDALKKGTTKVSAKDRMASI